MKYRLNTFTRIVFFTVFSLIISVCGSNVYADIISGDGSSSSSAEFKACDSAKRWQNVSECPKNGKNPRHGGASWHLFKTSNPPLAWGQYEQKGSNDKYHVPIYHTSGGGYTAAQVLTGYRAGWNLNGVRIKGEGPTDGEKRASEADWSSVEATALYRAYAGNSAAQIPYGTGWFCYNPPRYTLTAKAVNTNGASLSGVMADNSHTAIEGNRASVSRRTAAGYTFFGWSTSVNNATHKSFITNTNVNNGNFVSGSSNPRETFNVGAIYANTTVYAVYERNSIIWCS